MPQVIGVAGGGLRRNASVCTVICCRLISPTCSTVASKRFINKKENNQMNTIPVELDYRTRKSLETIHSSL